MKTGRPEQRSRSARVGTRKAANQYDTLANARRRLPMGTLETRVALHPFFAGMSPAHLAFLAAGPRAVHFRRGVTILRTGEFADGFYLLESGVVTLASETSHGDSVTVTQLHAGDLLGCSWMFPPYVWRFTARAAEPVSALFFEGALLRDRCEKEPVFGYALLKRAAAVILQRMQAGRERMLGVAA